MRITLIATALVATVLALVGAGVVFFVRHSFTTALQKNIRDIAVIVEFRAEQGTLPVPLEPPIQLDPQTANLRLTVQVLDGADHVVTSDEQSQGCAPILTMAQGETERTLTVEDPDFHPGHMVYVVALKPSSGGYTTIVAGSIDSAHDRSVHATKLIVVGWLNFVLLVIVLSWMTVGFSLRPAEWLRHQVVTITRSGKLNHRLQPVPGSDEISRLADTLNELLHGLDQAVSNERRFVADAAHELRTPLAGMTAFLEVAASHPASIDRDLIIKRLTQANRHLNNLVDDLLMLATLGARHQGHRRRLDLAGIIEDGIRHVDPGSIRIRFSHHGPAMVIGDDTQLTRVIVNLVENAVRHARSVVRIHLRNVGYFATIAVIDDGPGIPVADRERIWLRFVRLDNNRDRATGGTGLGLPLVKEILLAHRGLAWVADTQPGPGATFVVRLPLLPWGSRRSDAGVDKPSSAAALGTSGRG